MVKAVQAEESISVYFDGLLKNRVQAEVGLLVGKAGVGSRDLALAVIPTPSQDGEQVLTISAGSAAAKPKKAAAGKAKSNEPAISIQLEADDIAEHALQVSRMLPGGVSILGLYIFAPESGYSSCSSQLCNTLASIAADSTSVLSSNSTAAAAAALTGAASATTAAAAELLLLHVDSSSRKFTLRSCQVSNAATANSTLKPCELKFGSSLSSLIPLRCSHHFDTTLPAAAAAAAGVSEVPMQQLLQQAIAAESARVQSAVAAVAGQVPTSISQPIGDLLPGGSSSSAITVDLYCLPHATAALQNDSTATTSSSSSSSTTGSSRVHGTVEAIAYVHKRDPVSKALSELRNDVISSLAARLQLLADEALAAADSVGDYAAAAGEGAVAAAAHPLLVSVTAGKRLQISLPRRVLVPWSSLNIQVCDYLSEGEGPEQALQRAQQLLQLNQVDASAVVQLESPAAPKPKVVAATAVQGSSSSSNNRSAGSGSVCTGPVLAAAAAGLVAAVSVGVAYISIGQ